VLTFSSVIRVLFAKVSIFAFGSFDDDLNAEFSADLRYYFLRFSTFLLFNQLFCLVFYRFSQKVINCYKKVINKINWF